MTHPTGICKLNTLLQNLRKNNYLTYYKFGQKVGGYHRETVFNIEHGNRYGGIDFWLGVQKEFGIPDEDMWKLILGKSDPEL